MSPATRPAECVRAIEALITWYDDLTHGQGPSVARRRAIIDELRRAGPHPEAAIACDVDLLARPDPAHVRTDSLLAIERLRLHTHEEAPAIGTSQPELHR